MTEEPLALRIGLVRLRLSPQPDGPSLSIHAEDIVSVSGLDAEAAEARKIEQQRARETAERIAAERRAAEELMRMEMRRMEEEVLRQGDRYLGRLRSSANTYTNSITALTRADAAYYEAMANNQSVQYAQLGVGQLGNATLTAPLGNTPDAVTL